MNKITRKLVTALLLASCGTANAASLVGSNVTGANLFPNTSNPTLPTNWTVTSDATDLQTWGGIDVNVVTAIGSNDILYRANRDTTYATGSGSDPCNCINIDGLVWDLNVDPTIVIADVQIAQTTGGFASSFSDANILFDSDTVRIDLQGITVMTGDIIRLNVIPTPIPPAVWLFGTGLLGLAGVARRKKAA
jgi:hypothetical protein